MGFGLALIGRLKLWFYVAGAALVAIVGAYFRGRSDEAEADHERELNEYVETRRRIDEGTIPHDADGALDWLRRRQSDRDL